MTDKNPGEEHACCAKDDAPDFDTAERHSHYAYESENTDRVCDGLRLVKFEKPGHALTSRALRL